MQISKSQGAQEAEQRPDAAGKTIGAMQGICTYLLQVVSEDSGIPGWESDAFQAGNQMPVALR